MPLRIVLVRHGQSSFNLEQRIQGRDDRSTLTEKGRSQARRTGVALADLPLAAAYCSPLSRARDTATLLLEAHGGALSPCLDQDLLEIDLAPWSGLLRRELTAVDPEGERLWREAPEALELTRPDGSSYRPVQELMQQAERFVQRLLRIHADFLQPQDSPGGGGQGSVLVVAHNGILRCLLLQFLSLPASGFSRFRLGNASISVLNLSGNGAGDPAEVQIESLNGSAHLGVPLPGRGPGPRLVLVRHGETDWNREGRFQGQIDIPLNANGLSQADAARRFLAGVKLDRAYTSSMSRPRQTAEVILTDHPGVPLTSTDGLREIGHGLWEGCLEEEIAAGWPQLLAAWKRAPETVQMPEGETIQDVGDRSLRTWMSIVAGLAGDETALVVAHDAVNKTILCALMGLTTAAIWCVKQGNGGVTVIDYPDSVAGPPVVACLNLTNHLGGVLDRTAAGAL